LGKRETEKEEDGVGKTCWGGATGILSILKMGGGWGTEGKGRNAQGQKQAEQRVRVEKHVMHSRWSIEKREKYTMVGERQTGDFKKRDGRWKVQGGNLARPGL